MCFFGSLVFLPIEFQCVRISHCQDVLSAHVDGKMRYLFSEAREDIECVNVDEVDSSNSQNC